MEDEDWTPKNRKEKRINAKIINRKRKKKKIMNKNSMTIRYLSTEDGAGKNILH